MKLDEKKASTWDILTRTTINIMSMGLKQAAAIVVTVLQSVIPDNQLVSYSDYSVVSIYNSSPAVKWGEVYNSVRIELNGKGGVYMIKAYIRVSTEKQNEIRQLKKLVKELGAELV